MAIGGHEIHLLNTSIIPSGCDGTYECVVIGLPLAKHLYRWGIQRGNEGQCRYPMSHVGHESTAAIMNQLLEGGGGIKMDRTPWDGDGIALVLQMDGRPPEGKILTEAEMKEFGFKWRILRRTGPASDVLPDLDGGPDLSLIGMEAVEFEGGVPSTSGRP